MKYQHLIWDFDGTICDTMPTLARALCAVLIEQGVANPDFDEIRLMLRETMYDTVATMAERHNLDTQLVYQQAQRLFYATPKDQQPLFPGVVSVLEAVQAAGGENYLYTHHAYHSLMRYLELYDLTPTFVDIVSAKQEGHPRKPDPTGFLSVMADHDLNPATTLAVGDRRLDMEAGHAAGIATCWYGALPPPDDLDMDYVIDDYAALPAILGLT